MTVTLGKSVFTLAAASPKPVTVSYTSPAGTTANYAVSFKSYTVKTNFGCSVSEYGPINNSLPDRVTLPDGTFYQFSYEATPGFSGDITGRLAAITLPTGGSITYTYTGGGSRQINFANISWAGL